MRTAYTFGVLHIYILYLVSSYLRRDQIRHPEGTPDEHTEYAAKMEAANTTLLCAVSSKHADDFLSSDYVLDICCDGRWMNISRSQAVVLLLQCFPQHHNNGVLRPV